MGLKPTIYLLRQGGQCGPYLETAQPTWGQPPLQAARAQPSPQRAMTVTNMVGTQVRKLQVVTLQVETTQVGTTEVGAL